MEGYEQVGNTGREQIISEESRVGIQVSQFGHSIELGWKCPEGS